MKPIILPVLLLLLVISFTIFNGTYTANTFDNIIRKIEELPDIPDANTKNLLEKIENDWNAKKELYSSIIKYDFILNFTKELSTAKAGCTSSDDGTYLSSKKSMKNLLEYMRDMQKFRLDNIV